MSNLNIAVTFITVLLIGLALRIADALIEGTVGLSGFATGFVLWIVLFPLVGRFIHNRRNKHE